MQLIDSLSLSPMLSDTMKLFFIKYPESIILFYFANFSTTTIQGFTCDPSSLLTLIPWPIKGKVSAKSY